MYIPQEAIKAFGDAWAAKQTEQLGKVRIPGEKTEAGLKAALAIIFEFDGGEFFTTRHTPHQWSSGPSISGRYATLEEAKKAAEDMRSGRWGSESLVVTTYGVQFKTEVLK